MRILHRRNDASDARGDDAFRARTGTACVRTGFERAVERGASRAFPRFIQRVNFSVRLAGAFVRAIADNDALVGHDACPDDRIRRGPAQTAARLFERTPHPVSVFRADTLAGRRYHFS
jgi:hypothetical protein